MTPDRSTYGWGSEYRSWWKAHHPERYELERVCSPIHDTDQQKPGICVHIDDRDNVSAHMTECQYCKCRTGCLIFPNKWNNSNTRPVLMRAFVRFVDNHTCEMDCLSFPPEDDDRE
jgi:hypothetical protein